MEPKRVICCVNNSIGWLLLFHFQSSISRFWELLNSKHRGTIDINLILIYFGFEWILFRMNSCLYVEYARISNVFAVIRRSEHIFNVNCYVCVQCWFIVKDSVLTKKLWDGSVHRIITGILHRYRCKVLKIRNFFPRPSKKQNQNLFEIKFLSRLVLERF